jgi:hypothetical protein
MQEKSKVSVPHANWLDYGGGSASGPARSSRYHVLPSPSTVLHGPGPGRTTCTFAVRTRTSSLCIRALRPNCDDTGHGQVEPRSAEPPTRAESALFTRAIDVADNLRHRPRKAVQLPLVNDAVFIDTAWQRLVARALWFAQPLQTTFRRTSERTLVDATS